MIEHSNGMFLDLPRRFPLVTLDHRKTTIASRYNFQHLVISSLKHACQITQYIFSYLYFRHSKLLCIFIMPSTLTALVLACWGIISYSSNTADREVAMSGFSFNRCSHSLNRLYDALVSYSCFFSFWGSLYIGIFSNNGFRCKD